MRIVIIDDEGITRQWLKKKIEELDVNYHVVGEFVNGKQAVDFCRNHEADVIFTDIMMPVMDGLEFLAEIKDLEYLAYKIILSAYDEFHYARQAMRLGANEFVLKPEITKEKLRDILKEAEEFVESRKKEMVLEDECDSGKIFGDFYTDLLDSQEPRQEKDIREYFCEKKINLEPENLVTAVILVLDNTEDEKIQEIIQLFIEEQRVKGYCLKSGRQKYVLVYNQTKKYTREEFIESLIRILKIHLRVKCYVGVSTEKNGYGNLKELFRQGLVAMENSVFWKCEEKQLYDYMVIRNSEEEWCYGSDIAEIIKNVENEEMEKAYCQTKEFFHKAEQSNKVYFAYFKALCMQLLSTYIQKTRNYTLTQEQKELINKAELSIGNSYSDFYCLREEILEKQGQITEILDENRNKNKYSVSVQMMVEYARQHYSEKISLEQIAEQIHMNRTYISAMFKRETGEKFSDYLQSIRLENACKLLQNHKNSIQDIAEQSGFFDAAHFGRVFKEKFHMTPLEYRREKINEIQ